MPEMPQAPITVNQTIITGPNMRPTAPVPRRWVAKRTTMIAAVIGTIRWSSEGSTTFRPSTEDSTEIAGVIMLSPRKSEAPKIPSAASAIFVRRPPAMPLRRIRVISAMIPPSPSLSALITRTTYWRVTMIVTDQKISEMIPKTVSLVAPIGCGSLGLKTVWIV